MVYEYMCDNCGPFNAIRSYKERHIDICPHCGGNKVAKLISNHTAVFDVSVKDQKGTPIWFPKDGKPYFDKALQKTFYNKKEKQQYMKEKKLVMDGSLDNPNRNRIPEAGDTRKSKTLYV